jgi:hypothetical protein
MARRTVGLLALAAGLIVTTAGACPDCEALPPDLIGFCQEPPIASASDDSQPQPAAGEEPSAGEQPDVAELEPERAGS